MQHRAISNATPSAGIGRAQDRLKFFVCQVSDQARVSLFARDCKNPSDLLQRGWLSKFHEVHKRLDGRQTCISRRLPIPALRFQVV
jgi:hypothetical protein